MSDNLVLDNPIWHALTSRQQHLAHPAMESFLAQRFPYEIGPLAGMVSQTPEAYQALATLAKPNEPLVLFLDTPLAAPEKWTVDLDAGLTQMILERPLEPVSTNDISPLTDEDIPAMLALTALTKPGPFRERTIDLGGYIGIKESGKLVAMAGKRLQTPGFVEISAVCTHPSAQGKGYAKRLITVVAQDIIRQGDTPFLHTWVNNTNAIRVYEKLGFVERRVLHAVVLRMAQAVIPAH